MNRTRFSPIDILGITLGVLVTLIVIGSVVFIARGRMFNTRLGLLNGRMFWAGEELFSAGGALRQEADEEIPAGTYAAVEVRNVAGSIDITGSSSASSVAVHSVKTARTQAGMDAVRVEVQRQGDRLIVEEKHDAGFLRSTGTVSFRLTLPAGVKILEARSVSGSIEVSGLPAGVDQALSTISGSVSTTAAHDLDISSTSGHISFVSSGASLKAHSVSGSIDGTIQALGASGSARLNSVSGSVNVNAYAGLEATIALHSVSGSVSCDFPVTISEQKRNTLKGKIGSGAARVDIGTVSGSITIAKD